MLFELWKRFLLWRTARHLHLVDKGEVNRQRWFHCITEYKSFQKPFHTRCGSLLRSGTNKYGHEFLWCPKCAEIATLSEIQEIEPKSTDLPTLTFSEPEEAPITDLRDTQELLKRVTRASSRKPSS